MLERLQKYMAECGVASRRKSEQLILEGRVTVNDNLIRKLGFKVDSEKDLICIDKRIIKPEENKIYIALNKPVGYISTVKDEKGRKTILDIVKVEERIYPIGRLDYDSCGLILLTNDGDIYNKIIHPRVEKNKVYLAEISGIPTNEDIIKFERGIIIDGHKTAPASFKILKTNKDRILAEITIHEGRNRQIRKMCEYIGHKVITLKRIRIGEISLNNLQTGEWRYLTKNEIEYLKNL